MARQSFNRKQRFVLISLACLLLFTACLVGWITNRGYRPAIISGTWIGDDLRVEDEELFEITFSQLGALDCDDQASSRWTYDGKSLHVQAWSNSSSSPWLHWLRDTNLYGWMANAETFPLTVHFNQDKTVMTLIGPEGPRLKLYRPGHEPR